MGFLDYLGGFSPLSNAGNTFNALGDLFSGNANGIKDAFSQDKTTSSDNPTQSNSGLPPIINRDAALGAMSAGQIAALAGLNPDEYGQYFSGMTEGLAKQRGFINQQYGLANQSYASQTQQGMGNLLRGGEQAMGNSGFSGFGAVGRELERGRTNILDSLAQQRNQLGLQRDMQMYNTEEEYYQSLLERLLQMQDADIEFGTPNPSRGLNLMGTLNNPNDINTEIDDSGGTNPNDYGVTQEELWKWYGIEPLGNNWLGGGGY